MKYSPKKPNQSAGKKAEKNTEREKQKPAADRDAIPAESRHGALQDCDPDITGLIQKAGGGDAAAREELFKKVLPLLKTFAQQRMARERSDHTLTSTELIHEVYLRFFSDGLLTLNDRNHFYAIASIYMRRFLVDYARRHRRAGNNNGIKAGSLDEEAYRIGGRPIDLDQMLDLNRALEELERFHPGWAKVVEMRYFGQLTFQEIADVLELSKRTVERYWKFARTWLFSRLEGDIQKEEA